MIAARAMLAPLMVCPRQRHGGCLQRAHQGGDQGDGLALAAAGIAERGRVLLGIRGVPLGPGGRGRR